MTDSTQAQAEPEGTDKGIVVTPPFSPHQLESRKGKSERTSVPGHNLLSLSTPFTISSSFPNVHLVPQDREMVTEGSNTRAARNMTPKMTRKGNFWVAGLTLEWGKEPGVLRSGSHSNIPQLRAGRIPTAALSITIQEREYTKL